MGKKRVCFVGLSNIWAAPYLYKYIELLDCEYDIIYWDRKGIEENCGAVNHYSMKYVIKPNASKLSKLNGYLKFRSYASRILKREKYHGVILLSGNVAVLLKTILKREYSNKYIVDIRDYFREHQKWYYNAEKDVLESAAIAVISSKAFRTFLPERKYYIVHNSQNLTKEQVVQARARCKTKRRQLVISCIGGMRFFEQYKKVIRCFANDNRFLIRFIGYRSNLLESFCRENGISNVYLYDWFPPEKTYDFYFDTDIVMNLYGNNNPLLDYALSNKLYYAAQLGMPILVSPKTYMEEVAVGSGFGFSFDLEDDTMRDKLYEYYYSIDWDVFYKNCDSFMEAVKKEEAEFREAIRNFIINA